MKEAVRGSTVFGWKKILYEYTYNTLASSTLGFTAKAEAPTVWNMNMMSADRQRRNGILL